MRSRLPTVFLDLLVSAAVLAGAPDPGYAALRAARPASPTFKLPKKPRCVVANALLDVR